MFLYEFKCSKKWTVLSEEPQFQILHRAERHPPPSQYGVALYDPVNNSISIYADTVNIFIRIAQILGMGGMGRKK